LNIEIEREGEREREKYTLYYLKISNIIVIWEGGKRRVARRVIKE
jgi:small nuclear ribonucleoprotein (snRNP)-like protein